ncbi:MAG TPA: LacI family DNA-binding transcriptional regulator [Cyclobacteriaceae bacterium]|nr:LacI family DNA-binding transcriptional regulator [Cyclobacteriaceae bacterium]
MATIHDIAKELNITASTVSRALNNHPRISEATKKAVLRVAKRLNYQPNHIAAALRNGRSNIIGIIVPTADRSFFGSVIRGIEEVAKEAHYNVMICQSHDDYESEVSTVEALLNARVDGIMVSFAKNTENFDHFRKVHEKGTPLVLFDRSFPGLDVSQVVIDDYRGAYEATEHLIQQGCKRIAHFTSVRKISIYKERFRGYRDALEAHNIPYRKELVLESYLQFEDGLEGLNRLLDLDEWPDAIFSASAYSAVAALTACRERGIPVPESIAIVGFANEAFTSYCDPPMSTVDQQSMQIGNAAAEIFLEQITVGRDKFVPKRIVLTPELLIRKSSLKNPMKLIDKS